MKFKVKIKKSIRVVDVVEKARYRDGGTILYEDCLGRKYYLDGRICLSNNPNNTYIYDEYPSTKSAKRIFVELNIVKGWNFNLDNPTIQ